MDTQDPEAASARIDSTLLSQNQKCLHVASVVELQNLVRLFFRRAKKNFNLGIFFETVNGDNYSRYFFRLADLPHINSPAIRRCRIFEIAVIIGIYKIRKPRMTASFPRSE